MAQITTLKSADGTTVLYPVTRSEAVYTKDTEGFIGEQGADVQESRLLGVMASAISSLQQEAGGHTIENASGVSMTARTNLQFTGATVTDDSTNDRTIIAITSTSIGAIATTAKGVANGVASLNGSGLVPAEQLPSYVDDVIEGYYKTADGKFYEEDTYTTEIIGETGKIYVDLSTSKTYRWSGSAFVVINDPSKADKVSNATNGNFAGLDSSGNLTDSGNKSSDFATSAQGIPSGGTAGQVLKKKSGTDYDVAWSSDNDIFVSQNDAGSTNADYRVLLSNGDYNASETGITRKSGGITFNPSTCDLNITGDYKRNGSLLSDPLTSVYNSATTYYPGDYFIYNNILYKVRTDNSIVSVINQTPPNVTYYTATTVGAELATLNSGLTNKLDIRKAYTSHTLIDTVTSNANGRYNKSISSLNTALGSYRSIALNTRGGDGDWFWFVMGHNPQLVSYILNTMNTGRFYILGFLQINGKGNNMEVDNSTAGQFDVSYANKTGYLYGFN